VHILITLDATFQSFLEAFEAELQAIIKQGSVVLLPVIPINKADN
jgi:hypothetical protein